MVLTLFKTKAKKKSRRKSLIAALDTIMSKKIRERDGHRCRKCGQGRVFHHHIFTKTRLVTRWEMRNGISLCFHCHRWAHAAAEEFRTWVLSWMAKKEYDALYLKSQMRAAYKDCDLEMILKMMRKGC